MDITLLSPADDKVVIWGMSCVGKTTLANALTDRQVYSFDALFPWHVIETFGLSTSACLKLAADSCLGPKFVLDGWHLSDPRGRLMPRDAAVWVLFAPYEQIIAQYRVPVSYPEEHRGMFEKWYRNTKFPEFERPVRYIRNSGNFVEVSESEFLDQSPAVITKSTN